MKPRLLFLFSRGKISALLLPLRAYPQTKTCRASQANCELAKMNSRLREEQRALRKEASASEHQEKLSGNTLKAVQAQL